MQYVTVSSLPLMFFNVGINTPVHVVGTLLYARRFVVHSAYYVIINNQNTVITFHTKRVYILYLCSINGFILLNKSYQSFYPSLFRTGA